MKRLFLSDIATNIEKYSDVCYFKVDGKTHKRKVKTVLVLVPIIKEVVTFKNKIYEIR